MADLKAGTTVGGALVWHQGNFPLKSVSDDVYYKTFKIYTEYNKPQAVDNDFVSKAQGGTYLGKITFDVGLNIKDKSGYLIDVSANTNTDPMFAYTAKMRLNAAFALENAAGQPFIIFNPALSTPRLTVMGDILGQKINDESGRVFSPGNPPTPSDVSLGNVTNDAQVKVAFSGLQTMAGPLAAPNFTSLQPATNVGHVPRLDQVIVKGTIIDFGEF
ncbi:hinge connector of long tail fiber protein distal connector [Edwardsiella phage PEi20]|uniref:Hinge connector of long tail fiber, distal connector n=2 Tax=Kanagawavirus pei20 TaxID=2844109 RepID=A0A0B6VPL7_9CAUD|nr:hinge connector of long tail fiber protein distal connector [Edwardsiella phage PEi20]BAQ22922.1 hinge connector of long tail fiber, distal connector [Edwardsiella phage PEi20]BAQ23223.1 hinge connector of long tail fiber, distal connector [Edwardsiella phage PEi26]